MSWTTRLTRGSVRLASESVKNLWGNDDPWHFFGVGDEPENPLVSVNHNNRRSHVVIPRIELLRQLVPLQLRLRFHDRRIRPGVILHGAIAGIVAQSHAPRHDIAVRDRAEIAAIFGIVDDRYHRDVL